MKKNQQAFTIVELMVVVAVLAILIAIAVPSLRTTIANNRSTGLAGEMVNALNVARSEAIKRGQRVTVCSSDSGATCTDTPWQNGWIVISDNATSDTAPAPVQGKIIKLWGGSASGAVVNVHKGAAPGTALKFVRFNNQGMLARASSDAETVAIDVYQDGCQGNFANQLEVGVAGRINRVATACP